jgi:hypothetical protein
MVIIRSNAVRSHTAPFRDSSLKSGFQVSVPDIRRRWSAMNEHERLENGVLGFPYA